MATANKRIVIVNEDDDVQVSVTERGSKGALGVEILDPSGNQITNGLITEQYDYISLSYTGSNLTTVVYKTGGANGTIVATLTLTYDSSDNLLTVTKT